MYYVQHETKGITNETQRERARTIYDVVPKTRTSHLRLSYRNQIK